MIVFITLLRFRYNIIIYPLKNINFVSISQNVYGTE